jgi:hypothetical protein
MGQRRVASPVTATTDLLAADILESEKSSPMEPDCEISSFTSGKSTSARGGRNVY